MVPPTVLCEMIAISSDHYGFVLAPNTVFTTCGLRTELGRGTLCSGDSDILAYTASCHAPNEQEQNSEKARYEVIAHKQTNE